MVNTEHMQQWIDALRSGEYRKITHHLEMGYGNNCAEGVACREALKDGVEMRVVVGQVGQETAFNGERGVAPWAVLAWLGLDHHPVIDGRAVVEVNDYTDQAFADIADGLYREYLKGPDLSRE